MTKTSHKKNRPFDFKLISLVEPHPVIYMRQIPGMSSFEIMKTKNKVWQEIANEMGYPVQFCLSRWNNLRGQFQKELKHCNELCPKSGVIRGSTWPYLERMRFLECTVQAYKPKKERERKRKPKEIPDLLQEANNFWESDESNSKMPEDNEEDNDMGSDFHIELHTTEHEGTHQLEEQFSDSFSIIEEIAEEIVGTEDTIVEDTTDTIRRIEALYMGFDGDSRERIERRIMAFLCKCQLRALNHQGIEDLYV
ncbi:uncharacterized protein LOC133331194 [Musca vetustissima]|uniref:uncharacterized protein LOC133331194 n=1 Tax=Musca vetustissima TaxID=27455 RepID=UPI002AB7BBAE|nr:uncharacterized protein LOC133331194 [Musca vetustissima]